MDSKVGWWSIIMRTFFMFIFYSKTVLIPGSRVALLGPFCGWRRVKDPNDYTSFENNAQITWIIHLALCLLEAILTTKKILYRLIYFPLDLGAVVSI